MIRVAWWTCALFAITTARIYERCELAQELASYDIDKDHISTWVCIAFHESRLDTSAQNYGSGDHGIFQISELYWCGPGKACGVPCTAFRDENIKDDIQCSLMIHKEHTRLQGDGFMAWVVYPQHCRQNTKKYLADCDGFPKNATSKTSYNFYKTKDFIDNNVTYSYNPNIDTRQPSYLAVSALVNNNFASEFEQNYTRTTPRNWLNYKIENIDELTLPVFNNKPKPTTIPQTVSPTYYPTTTTTIAPPIKPWRTIETNQFRNKIRNNNKDLGKVSFVKDSAKYDKYSTSYFSYTKSPTIGPSFAPTTYTTTTAYTVPRTYQTSTTTAFTVPRTYQTSTTTAYTEPRKYRTSTTTTYTEPKKYRTSTTTAYTVPKTYRTQITTTTYRPQVISFKPTTSTLTLYKFPATKTTTPASYRFFSSTPLYTQPPLTTKRPWYGHQTFPKESAVKLPASTIFGNKSWSTSAPITRRVSQSTYKYLQHRSTQSIFDLYLNPTRRPPLSSYKFSSTNDSPFKLRIFDAGTTTPSPFAKSASFGGASRNQLKRDTQFHA